MMLTETFSCGILSQLKHSHFSHIVVVADVDDVVAVAVVLVDLVSISPDKLSQPDLEYISSTSNETVKSARDFREPLKCDQSHFTVQSLLFSSFYCLILFSSTHILNFPYKYTYKYILRSFLAPLIIILHA